MTSVLCGDPEVQHEEVLVRDAFRWQEILDHGSLKVKLPSGGLTWRVNRNVLEVKIFDDNKDSPKRNHTESGHLKTSVRPRTCCVLGGVMQQQQLELLADLGRGK